MIQGFRDRGTAELFLRRTSARWAGIKKIALRKLDQIEAAIDLNDLKAPPGNRLEALKGNRAGQHNIRINYQFRICFVWKDDGAHDVEIVDYY